ncbi:MAG: YchJ family protein [Desulfovibrionaceae bacterium]|nr:YchJ family protein [Desulfovibrionaceae bacterium]
MALCPCGSGLELDKCCGPYIEGAASAPTAEALMRSRYTAHALGKFDYLNETVHPSIRNEAEHEDMKEWSKHVEWSGLDIIGVSSGRETDSQGEVEFEAHYTVKGSKQSLHENAFFVKEDGKWYYSDGELFSQEPYRRESPKVGRNDPCPCGSGKKYKKCCGK